MEITPVNDTSANVDPSMSDMPEPQRLTDARILVVDDDPDVSAVVDAALRAEGAKTKVCSDGNTAVHLCEQDSPDLVVLDMMLPKRSGFLVLERIKQMQNPPNVIMITANEGKRHQAYAVSLGVDAYLHKPVRLERLVQIAEELVTPKVKARGGK
ncbi:MAG: response regulator [Phycisphaeraceae bacterium]